MTIKTDATFPREAVSLREAHLASGAAVLQVQGSVTTSLMRGDADATRADVDHRDTDIDGRRRVGDQIVAAAA
jgi:hypothetical protein